MYVKYCLLRTERLPRRGSGQTQEKSSKHTLLFSFLTGDLLTVAEEELQQVMHAVRPKHRAVAHARATGAAHACLWSDGVNYKKTVTLPRPARDTHTLRIA
eukprot:COSAG06_NODE_7037_length_2663_cov_1.815984_4_plen_101_part_00